MRYVLAVLGCILAAALAAAPSSAADFVEVVNLIDHEPSAAPEWIAVDDVAGIIYISHSGTNQVWRLEEVTHRVTTTYTASGTIKGIAVDPATEKVYLAVDGPIPNVEALFGSDLTLDTSIPLAVAPTGIAVDSIRQLAYVSSEGDPQISVIDLSGNYVATTLNSYPALTAIALNESTNRIYATSSADEAIITIEGDTFNSGIRFDGTAYGRLAVNEATNRLWALVPGWSSVFQLDPLDDLFGPEYYLNSDPADIAVSSFTNLAYITEPDNYQVEVIDGNEVLGNQYLSVGSGAKGIAVNERNGRIYVCNTMDGSLSVFDEGGSEPDTQGPRIEGWGVSEFVVDKGGDVTNIGITVSDESHVQEVSINGVPLTNQGNNQWNADIQTDPLADYGEVHYQIYAKDEFGNESTGDGYYKVARGLHMRIKDMRTAPADSRAFENVIVVAGKVVSTNPGWTFEISDGSSSAPISVWARDHNFSVGQFLIVRGQGYGLQSQNPSINSNLSSIEVVTGP